MMAEGGEEVAAKPPPAESRCGKLISFFCVRFSERTRWNEDIKRTEVLQATRVFLMSGIFPKASTLFLILIRFLLMLAMLGSTVANYAVWTGERKMSPEAWFMSPSNWISVAVILYFCLLVYLGFRIKVNYVSCVEEGMPSALFIVAWDIYDTLLPLTTYHFLTEAGDFHDKEISFVLKTILAATFFWVECILGAHPFSKRIFTSPAIAAIFVIAYTAIIAHDRGEILYPALDWIGDPYAALGASAYAIVSIIFIGMFFYIIMSTRNDCIGIRPYRAKLGDDRRMGARAAGRPSWRPAHLI